MNDEWEKRINDRAWNTRTDFIGATVITVDDALRIAREAFEAGKRAASGLLVPLLECGECGARATCMTQQPFSDGSHPLSCDKHCDHEKRWEKGCVKLESLAKEPGNE